MSRECVDIPDCPPNMMHILALINDEPEDTYDCPIKPSKYFYELNMSTNERLENLYAMRKERVPKNCQTFYVTPDIIVFQNWITGKWYTATIHFLNKDSHSRHICIQHPESPNFTINYPEEVLWTKVAPGMSYELIVNFSAEEYYDYAFILTINTENGSFNLPIYAIQCKALIDFPDMIELSPALVHEEIEKDIILKNCGKSKGVFTISCIENKNCNFSPNKICLNPNESNCIKLSFKSNEIGSIENTVLIDFDDGLKLTILILCKVFEANIVLSSNNLSFEDTYISLCRTHTLSVENKSDHIVKYKWKTFKSTEDERLISNKFTEGFGHIQHQACKRTTKITKMNIIDDDEHTLIYERIYDDEVNALETNEYLFKHRDFEISPKFGDINPGASLSFTITFSPKKCEFVETWSYLSVYGKELRLPLRLCGTGLGPKFKLNVKEINANDIFLCSEHNYEINIRNDCDITGTIGFKKFKPEFGSQISCLPELLEIKPRNLAACTIKFFSEVEGKFAEKIEFIIEESQETLMFLLTGNVIVPYLDVRPTEIDFKIIAAGYKKFEQLQLLNNSQVSIAFDIIFEEDGDECAISCEDFIKSNSFPINPKEFHLEPSEGVVGPYGETTVKLCLMPNIIRKRETYMNLYFWNTKRHYRTVKIMYDCPLPLVECIPAQLDIHHCFITHFSVCTVELKNKSSIPAYLRYYKLDETNRNLSIELKESDKGYICIGSNESYFLEFKVSTSTLGPVYEELWFQFLNSNPIKLCDVMCNGCGPIVSVEPMKLDFGEITTLNKFVREVELINDSPIPAELTYHLQNGPFKMDGTFPGQLLPYSSVFCPIEVYVTEAGIYTSTLTTSVQSSVDVKATLTCSSVGFSIESLPPLSPIIDLGCYFTYTKFSQNITLNNRGNRVYKILLCKEDTIKSLTSHEDKIPSNVKLNPNYMVLKAKESCVMEITATSKKGILFEDFFYCHAAIEKSQKREIIFTSLVKLEFIRPSVLFCKPELYFRIDVFPDKTILDIQDVMVLYNKGALLLNTQITMPSPFFIKLQDELMNAINLDIDSDYNCQLHIIFYPKPQEKRRIVYQNKLLINYKNHPDYDFLPVTGELNYPTLNIAPTYLNFKTVPLGGYKYYPILIKNVTPLPVTFKWIWIEDEFQIRHVKDNCDLLDSTLPKEENLLSVVESNMSKSKDFIDCKCVLEKVCEAAEEEEETCCVEDLIILILFPLIFKYIKADIIESDLAKIGEIAKIESMLDYLNIVPMEACLNPCQEMLCFVRLNLPPCKVITAKALCNVIGGEEEPLVIEGTSALPRFKIVPEVIHLGCFMYNKVTEKTFSITNIGAGMFRFELDLIDINFGWMTLSIYESELYPEKSLEIRIQCFPDAIERINAFLRFQICWLEPLDIRVIAFGVYNQIYIHLPRPALTAHFNPNLEYHAITNLTNYEFGKSTEADNFPPSEEINLQNMGWVIVKYTDSFPSLMDIEMSIERQLMQIEYMKNKENFKITDMVTPHYKVDLGFVALGSVVRYSIMYSRYGPLKKPLECKRDPKARTVGLSVTASAALNSENLQEIAVDLEAPKDPKEIKDTPFTYILYFEVNSGAKISLQVIAQFAIPYVTIQQHELVFGKVRCGDCLRKYIKIINDGHLFCKWNVSLGGMDPSKSVCSQFFLTQQPDGCLKPNQYVDLGINFEPHINGQCEATLIISVSNSKKKIVIPIFGTGLEPQLTISSYKIKFDSVLPYSENNVKYITMYNKNDFPVEFYFLDYDPDLQIDEFLINLYSNYHNRLKFYEEYRPPGAPLPQLFNDLKEQLKARIEEEQSTLGSSNYLDTRLFKFRNLKTNVEDTTLRAISIKQLTAIIVFHGNALSNHVKAACAASQALHYEYTNIDRLIMDELAENLTEEAQKVNMMLDKSFKKISTIEEYENVLSMKPYDALEIKIEVLSEGRIKPGMDSPQTDITKTIGTPNTDTTATTFKTTKTIVGDQNMTPLEDKVQSIMKDKQKTFNKLPPKLLCTILAQKISKLKGGFVIESLEGTFIKKAPLAFEALIKATGNIDVAISPEEYMKDLEKNMDNLDYVEYEAVREKYPVVYQKYLKRRTQEMMKRIKMRNERKKNIDKNKQKTSRKPMTERTNLSSQKGQLTTGDQLMKKYLTQYQKDTQKMLLFLQYWDRKRNVLIKTKAEATDDGFDTPEHIGMPTWVLNNMYGERAEEFSINELPIMLSRTMDAKQKHLKYLEKNSQKPDDLYTVYMKSPDYRIAQISKEFTFHDCPISTDELEIYDMVKDPVNLFTVQNQELCDLHNELSPRILLKPNEIVRFAIGFSPKYCNTFEYKLRLGMIGWSQRNYTVNVKGVAELPRINMDPNFMFCKVLESKKKNQFNHLVYYREEGVFDFGSFLLDPENEKQCMVLKTKFKIQNISSLLCKITICLKNHVKVFNVHPQEIIVPPFETVDVTVSARPTVSQIFHDILIISIAHNPKIESVMLSCFGCPLGFEINPDVINFQRIYLNCTACKILTLANGTSNKLTFDINRGSLTKLVKISQINGKIFPFSLKDISFEFNACEDVSGETLLHLDVFDEFKRKIYEFDLLVVIDIVIPSFTYEPLLDFGKCRGQDPYTLPFTILSVGRYECKIEFEKIVDKEADKNIQHKRDCFEISVTAGILVPKKLFTAYIKFYTNDKIFIDNLPIFRGKIIDPFHETVVETFDIKVKVKTSLSKFEICPPKQIFFGYHTVRTPKVQTFQIFNKGNFPFYYEIFDWALIKDQRRKGIENNDDSAKTAKTAVADQGAKSTLKVGVFIIKSSTGIVEPNSCAVVEVTAKPIKPMVFQNTLLVQISNAPIGKHNGHKLKLYIKGAVPEIAYDDYDSIFKEQRIVNAFSENTMDTVFILPEQKMVFRKTCVGTTETARLKFMNTGSVPATILNRLSIGQNIFSTRPEELHIAAHSYSFFYIDFKPTTLTVYEDTLIITCENVPKEFNINLSGEGCVPQVTLIKPPCNEKILNFEPTVIGKCSCQYLTFQNTGIISCKIILEICNDDKNQLVLIPLESTMKYLICWDPETMEHSNVVVLGPMEIGEFYVKYIPSVKMFTDAEVKIHIVYNPFDLITVPIFAESYEAHIVFEDLKPFILEQVKSSENDILELGYLLDFEYVGINVLKKKFFKIKNMSTHHTFKFEIKNLKEVVFCPSVGHLKPSTEKQIIAGFFSNSPKTWDKNKVICKVYPIEYLKDQGDTLPWDERQQVIVWLNGEDEEQHNVSLDSQEELDRSQSTITKVLKEKPEPSFKLLPHTKEDLLIFINVISNYTCYECEVKEINFPPTYVMDSSFQNLEITNTGSVPLTINWTITCDEVIPLKVNLLADRKDKVSHHSADSIQPQVLRKDEKFVGDSEQSEAITSSTLFSSEQLDTDRSYGTWCENNVLPFKITPSSKTIAPNETDIFVISFLPEGVYDYIITLKSVLHNLSPNLSPLSITIKARSIQPPYYFELPPSDYIESRRLGKRTCDELVDDSTKVVEFESIGVGTIDSKQFLLTNPTTNQLIFEWQPVRELDRHLSYFHCHTATGVIEKGKSLPMTFSFLPRQLGFYEEFFKCYIKNQKEEFENIFLFVGTAREPNIKFDRGYVAMTTKTGIPVKNQAFLINYEDAIFPFKFLNAAKCRKDLAIEPSFGYLQAKQILPIELTFKTLKPLDKTFVLLCEIEKIASPLTLSVSCTCEKIQSLLSYIDSNSSKVIVEPQTPAVITFEKLTPYIQYDIIFDITNSGRVPFQYCWTFNKEIIKNRFDIHFEGPEEVPINETIKCKLTFTPLIKYTLKNYKLQLNIFHGSTYTIYLNGGTEKPMVKFSFQHYNFGNVLLQKEISRYYHTTLKITNNGNNSLTLEKGEYSHFLTTELKSVEILPKSTHLVKIYFHPFELGSHNLILPIIINGRTHNVKISGTAVPLAFELNDQFDKFIDLGSPLIGTKVTKTVSVINRSLCTINAVIDFYDRLPFNFYEESPTNYDIPQNPTNKEKELEPTTPKSEKSTKATSEVGTMKTTREINVEENKLTPIVRVKTATDFVTVIENRSVRLGPSSVAEIVLEYYPKEEIAPFTEKIYTQVQDYIEPIMVIKGKVSKPDFYLERSNITFGNIVEGYSSENTLTFMNSGDTGVKFRWELHAKESDFTIQPTHGYLAPHTNITFKIYFKPSKPDCFIKSRMDLHIENTNRILPIFLSGSCIRMPPARGIIKFVCPVRETVVKAIKLTNTTTNPWEIQPQVIGSFFFVPNIVNIPPKASVSVEITFNPLIQKEISSTLIFPLPDGMVVNYGLQGQVKPPKTSGKIVKQMPCKIESSIILPVANWLQTAQIFTVETLMMGKSKVLYRLLGNELIEVPPNSTRDYIWRIFPCMEGKLTFKVNFVNKKTNEYLFYDLVLQIISNPSLGTLNFSTCVRIPVSKCIKLENPLDIPVKYDMACDLPNIIVEKKKILEPRTVFNLKLTYSPLKQESSTGTFEAKCKQLGKFCYEIKATAYAPISETPIEFIAYFGQSATQNITLGSVNGITCKFEDSVFSLKAVDPLLKIITISFEPTSLDTIKTNMTVMTTDLGEFIYPLTGEVLPPKPQGPFMLKSTGKLTISFRNPFLDNKEFFFNVEPNIFNVNPISSILKSKTICEISVELKPKVSEDNANYPLTGKLIVKCINPDIDWIYFIKEDLEI